VFRLSKRSRSPGDPMRILSSWQGQGTGSRGAIGELARDRVRVTFGAQEDVRPWYGAADAFALASLYDPFPNAGARGDGLRAACDYDAAMRHGRADRGRRDGYVGTLSTSVRLPTGSLAWMFLPRSRDGAPGAQARRGVQSHGMASSSSRSIGASPPA